MTLSTECENVIVKFVRDDAWSELLGERDMRVREIRSSMNLLVYQVYYVSGFVKLTISTSIT